MRTFLERHDVPCPPWSSLDELLDRLGGVMQRRGHDPAFWQEASSLVEGIRADALRDPGAGLPTAQAELLSGKGLDAVVAELRAALHDAPALGERGGLRRLLAGRSAAGLAWATLLAAALGAAGAKRNDGSTTTAEAAALVAADVAAAPAVDAGTAAPALDAGTPTPESADVLVELFRDGSPEQIAETLEAMLAEDDATREETAPDAGTAEAATIRPPRPPGPPIGEPVPRYKGVSF
jgi:hypothetical protein